ncbi:MAG: hypothetical protein K2M30_05610 [Desulfovibrionaceae bacterium]|nr:hypothetical protein [Desulfovibrionaceae bacterium]
MRKKNDIEKIMQIDEKIAELVKQRSVLLHGIRVKGYVPSEVEKTLRQHWERYASEKTKDTSFVRTLFKILQQVEMQECGELSPGKFILTPSKSPLEATVDGTVSELLVHLVLLASAVSKQPITLRNVAISDYVFSTIKMLQTLGIGLTWDTNTITTQSFQINTHDVVVHLGESELSLYALLAFSLSCMGHIKCVGGLSLSMLSLSPIKELLAQCGVRITSLGGVTGIPARIESTQQIPETLVITNDIPKDMVIMLGAVFPFLKTSSRLVFEGHSEKENILELLTYFYTLLDVSCEVDGYAIQYQGESNPLPTTPALYLDPYHTFLRCIVPYFTGGSITIQGIYPETKLHIALLEHLKLCGLHVERTDNSLTVTKEGSFALKEYTGLPSQYFPILFVMYLASVRYERKAQLPSIPDNIDSTEVYSFLEALSIHEENGVITFGKEQNHRAWIAPHAYWIIAYAYAGFLFPGITLANPSDVTVITPHFWRFYNTLPRPVEYEAPVLQEVANTKRRLIVR